jgi:hypothetical protein
MFDLVVSVAERQQFLYTPPKADTACGKMFSNP